MSSSAGLLSPGAFEAKAIFFGLLMAFGGGITHLTLHSDATSIIGQRVVIFEVGLLIEDIRDLVYRFNRDVVFSLSPRSTNRVVHSIAKLALINPCPVFWVDDCHPGVWNLILEETSSVLQSFLVDE
ncbi:hypothetical protein ACOSP7_018051 [Xanthoceras sorbifolium]